MVVCDKVRTFSGRGFNEPGREIKLCKCRLEFLLKIGAQRLAPPRVLAFRRVCDPAAEFTEKLAGMKVLARPGDSIGSGHVVQSHIENDGAITPPCPFAWRANSADRFPWQSASSSAAGRRTGYPVSRRTP